MQDSSAPRVVAAIGGGRAPLRQLLDGEHHGGFDHLRIEHVALDGAEHGEIRALLRNG